MRSQQREELALYLEERILIDLLSFETQSGDKKRQVRLISDQNNARVRELAQKSAKLIANSV